MSFSIAGCRDVGQAQIRWRGNFVFERDKLFIINATRMLIGLFKQKSTLYLAQSLGFETATRSNVNAITFWTQAHVMM
jgi:hypothetical protein